MMKSLKMKRFWQSLFVSLLGFTFLQQPLLLLVEALPVMHDQKVANMGGDSNVQQAKASSAMLFFVYGLAFLVFALILVALVKFVHEYVSATKTDVDLKSMTKQLQKSLIKKKSSAPKGSRQFFREFTQTMSPGYLTTTTSSSKSSQQTNSWIGEDGSTASTVPISSKTLQEKLSKSLPSETTSDGSATEDTQYFDISKKTAPKSSDDDDSVIYMSNSSVIINKSGVQITSLKKNDVVTSLKTAQIKVLATEKNAKELVKASATDKLLKDKFDKLLKTDTDEKEEAENNSQMATQTSNLLDDNSKSVYSQRTSMYQYGAQKTVSILRKSPHNYSILSSSPLSEDVSIDAQLTPSSSSSDSSTSKGESSKVIANFGKYPLANVEKKSTQTKSVSFSRALNVRFYEK